MLCNVIGRIKKRWTDRLQNSWQHYIKAGIEAGNEEQIQHRLAELAKCILEYRNLYAEWQLGDEEIKKMRAHCEALRENVSLCRLAMQKEHAI